MLWHICAQRRQESAQRLHSSSSCFAHSSAQALQTVAQSRAKSVANFDCRLHTAAHCQQIEAQSRHARKQSAISGPILAQHCVTQTSHSWAHATHSSIQSCRLSLAMVVPPFRSLGYKTSTGQHRPETHFFGQSRNRSTTEAKIFPRLSHSSGSYRDPPFSTASLRPCACTSA